MVALRLRRAWGRIGHAIQQLGLSGREGSQAVQTVMIAPDEAAETDRATIPLLRESESDSARAQQRAEQLHQRGLKMARACRWNWSQRELELAARCAPIEGVVDDLDSVRVVRRTLRQLQKNPRDIEAHLLLGQKYFELEMGEDAERSFSHVIHLAPEDPRGYYHLALEYLYRDRVDEGQALYEQARSLAPDLPSFESFWEECRREGLRAG